MGQRSKAHQLKYDDQNTKFFHTNALERQKQDTILGLCRGYGKQCDDEESIAQETTSQFETIYITSHPSCLDEVTTTIPTKVIDDMNADLTREFTMEEVVSTLKQIHLTKTLGPDGMSIIFC